MIDRRSEANRNVLRADRCTHRRSRERVEESKSRRKTRNKKHESAGATAPAGHSTRASAATRFARQSIRESHRQAAHDRRLFVCVTRGCSGGRPRAGGGGRVLQLRIFDSSMFAVGTFTSTANALTDR